MSYKGRDAKIFAGVVERVDRSSFDAPASDRVLRTFAACVDRLQERVRDADETPAGPDGESERESSDDLAFLSFEIEPIDAGVGLRYGIRDAPHRTRAFSGALAGYARRIVRDLVRQVPKAGRPATANRLWFLWIESYLRATDERYNGYTYADEIVADLAGSRGRSFAVGFGVEWIEDEAEVISVRDARLRAAGLSAGDRVVEIDGVALAKMDLPTIQGYWLAPRPFEFRVTVRRDGATVGIDGESVPARHETLQWSMRDHTGYVRIRRFSRGSLVELRRALRRLERDGLERLVLDVRGNPGGALSPGLTDVFFKPGQTVVSYRDHAGDEATDLDATVEYRALPAAVLIDRESASMAEVLAAAFRTHERGPVVGERTVGKGVGQAVYPVLDEGRIAIVERTYFFPGTRDTWHEQGIEPSHEVELTEEDRERLGPYLEAPVIRLEEQWVVDPVLRAADDALRRDP